MDPATAVTTGWKIAKTAGEIGRNLYALAISLKDRDAKQQVDDILDQVRQLKQSASELEDENRDLREKLRFKSDDFQFHSPFWFDKAHPDQPLCPKCFANNVASPMGEPGQGCNDRYRLCLVCGNALEVRHGTRQPRF